MTQNSFIRSYVRPFVPFPKRRTLARFFPSFETKNIVGIFATHGIRTILDVGANKGQFAQRMRAGGFNGQIMSFEPNLAVHAVLSTAAAKDARWTVADPVAIGDVEGSAVLSIPEDSALASLLPFISQRATVPQKTRVTRLDEAVFREGLIEAGPLALKIDVQGLEHKVLDGAPLILKRARAILIECSLKPVYAGELNYLDILSRLLDLGFSAVFFAPVTNRKIYGESYQVDVLLVRTVRDTET